MQINKKIFAWCVMSVSQIFSGSSLENTRAAIQNKQDLRELYNIIQRLKGEQLALGQSMLDTCRAQEKDYKQGLNLEEINNNLIALNQQMEELNQAKQQIDMLGELIEQGEKRLKEKKQEAIDNVNGLMKLRNLLRELNGFPVEPRPDFKLEDFNSLDVLYDLKAALLRALDARSMQQKLRELVGGHLRSNQSLCNLLGQSFKLDTYVHTILSLLKEPQAPEKEDQRLLILLAKKALQDRNERLEVARAVLSRVYGTLR